MLWPGCVGFRIVAPAAVSLRLPLPARSGSRAGVTAPGVMQQCATLGSARLSLLVWNDSACPTTARELPQRTPAIVPQQESERSGIDGRRLLLSALKRSPRGEAGSTAGEAKRVSSSARLEAHLPHPRERSGRHGRPGPLLARTVTYGVLGTRPAARMTARSRFADFRFTRRLSPNLDYRYTLST